MKALVSILITLFLLIIPVPLSQAEGHSVRLGFILPDASLVNTHVIGRYYTAYLDELSKQTDWHYELVTLKATEAFKQLFAGDIDLLLSVEYPSYLGNDNGLIYGTMDFGYDVEGLYTSTDETRFDPQDLNTLAGARVGLIENRPANEKFEQFLKEHQLTLATQGYPDQKTMLEALKNKEIDLVVDTATNICAGERFLLAYARIPVRVAANPAGKHLLEEMERAISRLSAENPNFEPSLTRDLAAQLDFQLLHFTPQETQFIKELPPLRVVIYGGAQPYIQYDKTTGQAAGIYPDLLNALSKKSGLQFSYLHVNTYEEAIEKLKQGDADLMLDVFFAGEDMPFYYTNPLLQVPYTFIGWAQQFPDFHEALHLFVPRPIPSVLAYLQKKFPNWRFTATPADPNESISRVQNHFGDLALVSNSSLEIERPLLLYPDLTIIPDASIHIPTSLMISPTQPRMLQGILNKAITKLNPEKRTHIIQKHLITTRPVFSLHHLVTFYPLQSGLICGLILLLISVLLFLQHHEHSMALAKRQLQEKNEALTATIDELQQANQSKKHYKEMAETDALTGVLNKAAIEATGQEIFAHPPAEGLCHALFIIDLDHFKEANDTLGHQEGDNILRRFALSLIHIVRASDAVGRFGGDEFILLLNNLPQEAAVTIAQRIIDAAHNLEPADTSVHLSASIGIALYPAHGKDYQELLHNADQALYYVKAHGRDNWSLAGD